MKALLSILILFCTSLAGAQGLNLSVNPLISYPEQLKQLKQDCKALGFPPECDAREKSLNKDIKELSTFCKKNKYDARCQSLKRKPKEYISYSNQYCDENPNSDKCVRKREMKRFQQREKFKYCSKHPDSARCRAKRAQPKKKPYMDIFCEKYPTKPSCIKYFRTSGKNQAGSEDSGKNNLF